MPRVVAALRAELRPMLRLAGPVVLAEIGWVTMGIVDTIMVGRIGPVAIGAVGVGSVLFLAFAIFGMGLLLGLDTLVSQAFGARRLDECHRWLLHGLALSLLLAVPMTAVAWLGIATLHLWGFDPQVLALTGPYLRIVTWSLLPLLVYASFRRYLQALGIVAPITFALVSANVINAVANWVLIFGNLGAPAMGTDGSAWATLVSRVYLALVLLGAVLLYDVRQGACPSHRWTRSSWHVLSAEQGATGPPGAEVVNQTTPGRNTPSALNMCLCRRPSTGHSDGLLGEVSRRIELARLRRLVGLGFPAAMQVTLEIGVFAAAGALAARLDPTSLASHQIVLNIASFTFMVPLGIASAGAVRVGHAIGRRDGPGASRAGWTALLLGIAFMASASVAFLVAPRVLLRLFTNSMPVLATGTSLLAVAALFQPFDGAQGVATGVLRGAGDTRTPMAANLAAHWLLGLPTGYLLCFHAGWGVTGLWVGLGLGLVTVGLVLVGVWRRRIRRVHRELRTETDRPATGSCLCSLP